MKSEEHPEEIQRALDLLKRVVKSLGPTRQQLEREIGMSSGWASKVLNGEIELRVRHVLAILEICGVDPWRFFAAAFPQPGSEERAVATLFQSRNSAFGSRRGFASELSQALRRVVDLLESGADINAALQRRGGQEPEEGEASEAAETEEEVSPLAAAQTS